MRSPASFRQRLDRLRRFLTERLRRADRTVRARAGLTLLEMGLAVAVASSMAFLVTSTVASSLRMQMEADRLTVAAALAQTKLAQLLTNQDLSTGDSQGVFGADQGIYAGYEWSVHIREEKIDLAKVVEVVRLVVRIKYPRGDGVKGEYRVETFRRSLKTVE